MKHILTTVPLLLAVQVACAHEGHGLPGTSHWHASDSWGFVAAAVVAAVAALWWRSRK